MEKPNYGTGLYQDGVFYFTNPGLYSMRQHDGSESKDFTVLWNNKEYVFKANTTTPMVIAGEPPENVQHIRKQFAKNYAQGWFHQSKRYKELVKAGQGRPATYNEDTEFGNVIQACITPLPKGNLEVRDVPRESEDVYKATLALGASEGLGSLNERFKNYEPPLLGRQ